jgi:hypothetical protein
MKLRALTRLLYLFVLFWLVFAIVWFFRDSPFRYIYSIIGLVYSLVLFVLTYFIGKKQVWAWRTATILVGVGIFVSFFDQIGWIDIAYLVFSLFVLINLIKGWAIFNGKH